MVQQNHSIIKVSVCHLSNGAVSYTHLIGQKSYDRLLKKPMAEYMAQDCSDVPEEYARLIQLFQHTTQAFPFEGNRIAVYTEGYTCLLYTSRCV